MPPFTPKHVTRYLLWVVLALLGIMALAWYLLESPAHERIRLKRSGAAVQLRLPDPSEGPRATQAT
ncbi:MAG TPA: hypothetical protein VIY53_07320 [Acidobacteriaceae bacterium]